jgi:hypothetical protein
MPLLASKAVIARKARREDAETLMVSDSFDVAVVRVGC